MLLEFMYNIKKLGAVFRLQTLLLICVLSLGSIKLANASEEKDLMEVKLKFAFIYKFAEFIDGNWSAASKDGRIVINVFGELDNSQRDLVKSYQAKKIRSLPVIIKVNPALNSVGNSDIVFFTKGSDNKVKSVLAKTRKSVLSVGDVKYFTDKGGIVEFFDYRGKIRFRIDNSAAKSRGIHFNAKLLELAEVGR